VAGVGGVIIDSRGNQESSYAWSLGQAINNQEEEYALLKGIHLAKSLQLQSLNIVGDYENTRRSLVKGKPQNYSQSNIIKKIHFEISSIHKVSFFHVKRENNSMFDSQETRLSY
jgi:ribonuclease HI